MSADPSSPTPAVDEQAPVNEAGQVDRLDSPETAVPPTTGNSRVDAALRQIANLDGVEVFDHPARYEAVHDVLRDVLNGSSRAAS